MPRNLHLIHRQDGAPRDFDQRPDLYETLRRSGYRRTWRDDLDEFVGDVRDRPDHALVCLFLGALSGMAATVGLAFVWSWFL